MTGSEFHGVFKTQNFALVNLPQEISKISIMVFSIEFKKKMDLKKKNSTIILAMFETARLYKTDNFSRIDESAEKIAVAMKDENCKNFVERNVL